MQVSSSFKYRAKFDFLSLENCNRNSRLIVLLLCLVLLGRVIFRVLRLTFVDPVHSRWLSRPGKFRATCSSRARKLSPSPTRSTPWYSSQKQLEIPSSERNNFFRRNNTSVHGVAHRSTESTQGYSYFSCTCMRTLMQIPVDK